MQNYKREIEIIKLITFKPTHVRHKVIALVLFNLDFYLIKAVKNLGENPNEE